MMMVRVEDCPILFQDLKAGDIFSFVSTPGKVYLKTDKNYSVDYECEECNEENFIDLGNLCVELETGAFYIACFTEKVILYKKAELVLSV